MELTYLINLTEAKNTLVLFEQNMLRLECHNASKVWQAFRIDKSDVPRHIHGLIMSSLIL